MATPKVDLSNLVAFQNAAAGHDGTLSDPSGALFVKPCTKQEIEFYETVTASYPELAEFMPTYLGTLNQSAPAADPSAETSTALKGKALKTDTLIVLSNTTSGFTRANVLDLKLGAQLWDNNASQEKRDRLDKVANETTSSSLGFRIAGMRTWQGESPPGSIKENTSLEEDTNMLVYNKLYGRAFNAENVLDGFRKYLIVPQAGIDVEHSLGVTSALLDGVKQLRDILEKIELRMYSASILMVYEGHGKTFDEKHKLSQHEEAPAKSDEQEDTGDDDDDDAEENRTKLLTVKLIDFAHATFTKDQGPDENMLRGVRNVVKLLEELQAELQQN